MRGSSLASIPNIAGNIPQAGANTALSQGAGAAGPGGLMAFLNTMTSQDAAAGGNDLAAKIAAILKSGSSDANSLTTLLQKLYPNASADQLQQAVTQLEAGSADVATVKATLTSDLSSTLAPGLQQSTDIISQLQQQFDTLQSQGPVTPDKLAQFRKDAVDFMKSQGLDNASMDQYLSSLASSLGSQLTAAQAALLSVPVPGQAAAAASASAIQSTSPAASTPAAASAADGDEAPASGNTENTNGLPAAASTTDTSPAAPVTQPQADNTPASEQAAAKTIDQHQQGEGLQALKSDNNASASATQQASSDNSSASAKPLSPAATSFFVMNAAQQDSNTSGNSGNGQQGFQNAADQSLNGLLPQGGIAAGAQSFVNYMTSSPSSAPASTQATAQNVAVQIQQNASQGITTFTMQLEPAELGRLEVRLKFERDGTIKAHLTADKPETLSMLRNDSAQIHRILQQAGLDADENSLSFDLRQQSQQQDSGQAYSNAGQASAYNADTSSVSSDTLQANIAIQAAGYIRQGGVNIMV
jgi:flagellar hook-length control protein FliK